MNKLVQHKILHLTLKKKWFDMIKSGQKKSEYRENKQYWRNRLIKHGIFQPYTHVLFRNGYGKDKPSFLIEIKSFDLGFGHVEWGAPTDNSVIIINLGKIINKLGGK